MPLRTKILLSMIVPALLLLTVGVVGITSLRHLKEASGRILSHNYHTIEEAREMERALRQFEGVMLSHDPETEAIADSLSPRFERSLRRCEENITEKGERETLLSIRSTWEALKPALSKRRKEAELEDLRAFNEVSASLYAQINTLVAINEKAMFAHEEQTRQVAGVMLWGVTGALFLAAVALASFSIVSATRISGPIVEVSARLHQALNPLSSERLAGRQTVDEIALLREELDKLLQRLAQYEDEQHRRLLHMQNRLAFVINEVLEGLVLIDAEHRIVAVNRVARQILGLDEGEGKRLDEIRPREDVRRMLKPVMAGTFQPERDLGELKFTIGDTERVYRPRALAISSGGADVGGYLLLFWDVTEQRRFEESRRKFISMLSHQLKTPMTSLSMSVNLLREKLQGASAAQRELLSIAWEDCSTLAGLISDLIEAAREPSPDLTLRLKNIDIVKLLRAGLRPLIAQAEEKRITLHVPKEGEALKAWVDPVKFPWVVTNIAGNALRYTPEGGRIEVSVARLETDFVVTVSDTGIGIEEEDLTCLFEPYVTLDSEPQRGTHGLGLAIAKEIVEAHRGRINVESTIGKGTVFYIEIPYDSREVA